MNFGGELCRWSDAFSWFVDLICVRFYHKISGKDLGMQKDEVR